MAPQGGELMTVTQESIMAYHSVLPVVENAEARVLAYIRANPKATNESIGLALGMPIQSVTPCTYALKAKGLIWITGRGTTTTGRTAAVHSVARCIECGRTGMSVTEPTEGTFDYICSCGCRFHAHVGTKHSQEVITYKGASE